MTLKNIILYISITLCLFFYNALSQSGLAELEIMDKHFRNFEYEKVVSLADSLLVHKDNLNQQQLLSVYRMRALSNYSLLQMNLALKDFIEILKINPAFSLNPVKTSPKIMTFFNEIKSNFRTGEEKPQIIPIQKDTIQIVGDTSALFKSMLIRSTLIPGWGHLYLNNSAKGWLLTTAGTLSLGGAVYYIIDCHKTEKTYLNETNPALINIKYNDYNTTYKKRNILIATYAVFWLYSQTDILFFKSKKLSSKMSLTITPSFGPSQTSGIHCSIHF